MIIDKEIWKPVPSKEGLIASSYGRIKLPEGSCKTHNGGTRTYKTSPTYGHLTKANKRAKYVYMNLSNRKLGNIKVHQAVCEAFHGKKPFDNAVVIHLDEDSTNNHYLNLKWGTQKENLNMPGFIQHCRTRTPPRLSYVAAT